MASSSDQHPQCQGEQPAASQPSPVNLDPAHGSPGPGQPPQHTAPPPGAQETRGGYRISRPKRKRLSPPKRFFSLSASAKKGGFITRGQFTELGASRQQTFRESHTALRPAQHKAAWLCLPAHLLVLFTLARSLQRKLSLTLHASPCPQHPLPRRVLCSGGIQSPRGKGFSSDHSGSHCSK